MEKQNKDILKAEYWDQFWQEVNSSINRCPETYEKFEAVFYGAFDRIYALGKQEKDAEETSLWERLTDREKHNLRRHYHRDECVLRDHKKRTGDKAQTRATTRMRLLENLFGKDNINPCDDE